MKELSLFTGAGGGILGSKILGWRTLGYVEFERYPQEIIKQRIADGILDAAPIFGDIRKFISEGYADAYQGMVDIVTGGPPCQPDSVAGKRLREADARDMWRPALECINIIMPKYVFFENVPGIKKRLYGILCALQEMGYRVRRPVTFSAAGVGAGHLRNRVWIFAYIDPQRFKNHKGSQATAKVAQKRDCIGLDLEEIPANIDGKWELQSSRRVETFRKRSGHSLGWEIEPNLVRVVYGIPRGMDRIAALGNAQVPLCMAYAFSKLSEGIIE